MFRFACKMIQQVNRKFAEDEFDARYICEPMNFAQLFYFPFSWLRFHVILRVLLISSRFYQRRGFAFTLFYICVSFISSTLSVQRPDLFVCTMRYSAQPAILSTHPILAEVVDVIPISLPVPVSSRSRKKRDREKSAHSSTSPSAETETTKCLPRKCMWKGLNALEVSRGLPCRSPFLSPLSFPSHPMRSRFHCFLSLRPHRRVNLFHVAVSSRISHELCASYIVTGCIPPRFETSHERDSSLFIYPPANGFLPSCARNERSAKESSLKYPPASCRAVNRVDAAPTLASFIETSGVKPPRNHTRRQTHRGRKVFESFTSSRNQRDRRKRIELAAR